jgi:cytochrome c556
MLKNAVVLSLCVLALAACGGEPDDAHPGQPVAHRRAAFKEILRDFEPMGVMLRTDSYNAQQFQMLVKQFMAVRNGPWGYFVADSQYPPSRATADVWSDAQRFAAKKQAFFDATDKLAAVAETGDKKAVFEAYEAAQNACRNCHRIFKTE